VIATGEEKEFLARDQDGSRPGGQRTDIASAIRRDVYNSRRKWRLWATRHVAYEEEM
jgi:hypothetical protein